MTTQAKVALDKQQHPERYCREPRCLWKVIRLDYSNKSLRVEAPGCVGGRCPRHKNESR